MIARLYRTRQHLTMQLIALLVLPVIAYCGYQVSLAYAWLSPVNYIVLAVNALLTAKLAWKLICSFWRPEPLFENGLEVLPDGISVPAPAWDVAFVLLVGMSALTAIDLFKLL